MQHMTLLYSYLFQHMTLLYDFALWLCSMTLLYDFALQCNTWLCSVYCNTWICSMPLLYRLQHMTIMQHMTLLYRLQHMTLLYRLQHMTLLCDFALSIATHDATHDFALWLCATVQHMTLLYRLQHMTLLYRLQHMTLLCDFALFYGSCHTCESRTEQSHVWHARHSSTVQHITLLSILPIATHTATRDAAHWSTVQHITLLYSSHSHVWHDPSTTNAKQSERERESGRG